MLFFSYYLSLLLLRWISLVLKNDFWLINPRIRGRDIEEQLVM